MSIEDFLDFMPDTVTVTPYVSTSANGAKTYDTANIISYPARVEMRNHLVLDKAGREVTARGTVYLGSTVAPGISDLLTLPAGFTPRTPPMIDINIESDEDGIHHIKLEIG
jgi:hypothetical protein